MELFPLYLSKDTSHHIFRQWLKDNIEWINEKHGSYVFTGNQEYDKRKHWSWYEVDAVVLNKDGDAEFRVYGMRDTYSGGRGALRNTFTAKIDPADFAVALKNTQLQIAISEHARREHERVTAEVRAIASELFPGVDFSDAKIHL